MQPTFMGPTFFKLFLESGDVFLLASRKRVKCKAAQYLIALTTEGIKRDKEESVAKVSFTTAASAWRGMMFPGVSLDVTRAQSSGFRVTRKSFVCALLRFPSFSTVLRPFIKVSADLKPLE